MKNALASIARPHRWFIAFLLAVQIVLAVRIATTNQWSAWINGDIQAVLTLRYWTRDGFFSPHAMLFITQGYTPFIQMFDATDLDRHALSSQYIKDGQLVRRIYYNHYPSFFLLPTGLLAAVIGSDHKLAFQLVQLTISALGVLLLYGFLYSLYRSRIAASIAAGFYALSNLYVDWAHSLANMPIDDLFRNGLLLLSVVEKHIEQAHHHAPLRDIRHSTFIIRLSLWISYFMLCFTSLESIVFGFVWIVGFDVLDERRVRWTRWFLFGLAPVVARIIQLAQSVVAFGWDDAMLDWFGRWNTMANQDGGTSILDRFLSVSREVRYLIGFGYDKMHKIEMHLMVILFVAMVAAGLFLLAKRNRKQVLIPALLFVAGSTFGLIFPGASWMRYEGRQFIPFFTTLIALLWISWPTLQGNKMKWWIAALLLPPILFTGAREFILSIQTMFRGHPVYAFGNENLSFAELGHAIHERTDNRTSMVFLLEEKEALVPFVQNPIAPDKQMVILDAQLLYAADAHILAFTNRDELLADLHTVVARTGQRITPYIVADSREGMNDLLHRLTTNGFVTTTKTDALTASSMWLGTMVSSTPMFRP